MLRLRHVLGIGFLVGGVVGAVMTYVAAQHNAQGEFNGPTGELSIARLAPIFFSWLIVMLLAVTVVALAWAVIRKLLAPTRR